jgi:hypothetical protein
MTMIQTTGSLPARCELSQVEIAVESLLAEQLKRERALLRLDDDERETYEMALDDFEDWADVYGLPCTAHVMAAYLIELRRVYQVHLDDLKSVAQAYLFAHTWDVRVPVIAALNYCADHIAREAAG